MKKAIIYFLVVAAIFSSCKKDDKSVFDQSPDDRLNAALAKYQAQLTGSPNGWKGTVFPAGGGAYSFYFKFNDSNRVKMISDFDTVTAVTLKESSYRLKALQQPSLIFDTYSYIHLLADPNENTTVFQATVNSGPDGIGLKSDFEFYFDTVTPDSIKLIGRYNGSKATLIRATAQEATAFTSGQLSAGFLINRFLTYFKRLTIGTQLLDVKISPLDRSFTFTYLNAGGVAQTFTTSYFLIPGGIVFINPLVIGNLTITGFNNMQWNATTETINMTVNNVASTVTGIVVPIKVDVGAPKRWWDFAVANGNEYWISINGFHVNGVDDAYNVNSLVSGTSTYFYLLYWPLFATANDYFAPIFLNAAQTGVESPYATGPQRTTFTADGRAVFTLARNYGTYPATGPAALSRTKLYNTSGYYFVQTSATSYDMVSASDGKAWITWEWIF